MSVRVSKRQNQLKMYKVEGDPRWVGFATVPSGIVTIDLLWQCEHSTIKLMMIRGDTQYNGSPTRDDIRSIVGKVAPGFDRAKLLAAIKVWIKETRKRVKSQDDE